jgi:hypothetical protein
MNEIIVGALAIALIVFCALSIFAVLDFMYDGDMVSANQGAFSLMMFNIILWTLLLLW